MPWGTFSFYFSSSDCKTPTPPHITTAEHCHLPLWGLEIPAVNKVFAILETEDIFRLNFLLGGYSAIVPNKALNVLLLNRKPALSFVRRSGSRHTIGYWAGQIISTKCKCRTRTTTTTRRYNIITVNPHSSLNVFPFWIWKKRTLVLHFLVLLWKIHQTTLFIKKNPNLSSKCNNLPLKWLSYWLHRLWYGNREVHNTTITLTTQLYCWNHSQSIFFFPVYEQ